MHEPNYPLREWRDEKIWSGDAKSDSEMKASRVFVVGVSIEEIRDDLQHWLKEACFVARLAAKVEESLYLHCLLPLLLKSKPGLPRKVCLVRMFRGHGSDWKG
jgi:hypothetical protein